jgi:diguanylate cyclase (GGDEF)-like protein
VSGTVSPKTCKEFSIFNSLEDRSPSFWIAVSIVLVGILGVVDFKTGNEYSFSLFYLLPISLTAWYMNRRMGVFTSVLSAVTWLYADFSDGEDYAHPVIYFWNLMIRLGFFLIVTYLLTELRNTQRIVQALSRTDHTTGAVNSRYFHELLDAELKRAGRYHRPFTLMYLDLDNFKQVNDQFGHEEGDKLITFIAAELKHAIRSTDTVARLGGDEFAILFPETGSEEARVVTSKVFEHLKERLCERYAFVTLSAGTVTYTSPPESTKEAIKISDQIMYSIKNSTKDGIAYSVYPH